MMKNLKIVNKKIPLVLLSVQLFLPCLFSQNAQAGTPENAGQIRASLVEDGKKYVGSPYQYGAIGPDSFDCSGFIFTVARESTGYQLPRTVKALYSYVKVIPKESLEKGDIVFFRTTGDGSISHAGIYIGNNQFMHAVSDGPNTGVIVSSLRENTWKNAYAGSGKFLPSDASAAISEPAAADNQNTIESAEPGTVKKASASSPVKKTAARTARPSKKHSASPFVNNLVFDASAGVDWSLFTANRFYLNFRGVPLQTNLRYSAVPLQPGLGVGFRFNTGVDAFQIPVVLSVTINDYIRAYAGPVITAGRPELPGDGEKIDGSFFPGIIGFSWTTPSFTKGAIKIQLSQDVSYTVFNKTDGGALSAKDSLAAGLVFSTGIRVTLPFSTFF